MTLTAPPESPVNRIRHLLAPAAPAEPPRHLPPAAADSTPPDPAESARVRAEAFDAALADAVRTLHGLLADLHPQTRLAAANAIINLKKASLRHRRPVYDTADDSFLPPMTSPGEIPVAEGTEEEGEADEDGEAVEAHTPVVAGSPDPATEPDRMSPGFEAETFSRDRGPGQETGPHRADEPSTNGVVGLTAAETERIAAEIGWARCEKLCARIAGKLTWSQVSRLVPPAVKRTSTVRVSHRVKRKPVKWSECKPVPAPSGWPPDPPAPSVKPKKEEVGWSPEELKELEEHLKQRRAERAEGLDQYRTLTVLSPG